MCVCVWIHSVIMMLLWLGFKRPSHEADHMMQHLRQWLNDSGWRTVFMTERQWVRGGRQGVCAWVGGGATTVHSDTGPWGCERFTTLQPPSRLTVRSEINSNILTQLPHRFSTLDLNTVQTQAVNNDLKTRICPFTMTARAATDQVCPKYGSGDWLWHLV